MDSTRQRKFASLMRRELSQLLSRELPEWSQTLISVNHVATSPDLGMVKVYLSCLPEEKLPHLVLELNQNRRALRHALSQRIRNTVKTMPDLTFFEDETTREAAKLEKLMRDLDAPAP